MPEKDTNDYYVESTFCDIEDEVYIDDTEPPLFCPMCGEQVDYNKFTEDEEDE